MGVEGDVEHEAFAVAVPLKKSSVTAPPGSSVMAPPGSSSVTVPAGNASSNIPMWQQEKQGAKCCGCCCDYRRAVIIIAIVTVCISLASIIVIAATASIPAANVQIDDDVVLGIYEDSFQNQLIFSCVSLVCSICALVGANKYSIPLVGINVAWYIGGFIAGTIASIGTANDMSEASTEGTTISVVPNIVVNAIVTCLFIYPHVGFMYEVKNGIMSVETYPREEFSCCCAPGARRA